MEWVETTAATIEEAKSIALDRLGVDEQDAEFEILEEPKPGLFGRMRGEARVRARVRPRSPRPKFERRRNRRDAGQENGQDGRQRRQSGSPAGRTEGRRPRQESGTMTESDDNRPAADPAQVAAQAEKFLVGLASAFGGSGTATSVIDGDDIEVNLEGQDLGLLVGPRGSTLQAVQDLTRVVAQRRLGDHDTRLRVDVGGYRAKRKDALGRFVNQVADEVIASGSARALEPMPSSDRKIIHDALTGRTDIATHSEGEEPYRRVVISPAGA